MKMRKSSNDLAEKCEHSNKGNAKKKKTESDERPDYVKINVDFRVIPYGTKRNQKSKIEADLSGSRRA